MHAHCCLYSSLSQAPPPGRATLPTCTLLDQAGEPGYSFLLPVDSLLLVHPQRKTTYVHCLFLFIPPPDITAVPNGCAEKDNLKQRTKLFFSPAPCGRCNGFLLSLLLTVFNCPSLSPIYHLSRLLWGPCPSSYLTAPVHPFITTLHHWLPFPCWRQLGAPPMPRVDPNTLPTLTSFCVFSLNEWHFPALSYPSS